MENFDTSLMNPDKLKKVNTEADKKTHAALERIRQMQHDKKVITKDVDAKDDFIITPAMRAEAASHAKRLEETLPKNDRD